MNNEKPTERKLRRIFKQGSESFFRANRDNIRDPRMSDKSQPVDRKEMGETQRSKEMEPTHNLSHIEVLFYANHGKRLDEDNRRYVVKPILDAIVSMGLSKDDKDITSNVQQRMDKDQIDF